MLRARVKWCHGRVRFGKRIKNDAWWNEVTRVVEGVARVLDVAESWSSFSDR